MLWFMLPLLFRSRIGGHDDMFETASVDPKKEPIQFFNMRNHVPLYLKDVSPLFHVKQ
jgi:hypothetical protein